MHPNAGHLFLKGPPPVHRCLSLRFVDEDAMLPGHQLQRLSLFLVFIDSGVKHAHTVPRGAVQAAHQHCSAQCCPVPRPGRTKAPIEQSCPQS